MGLYEASVCILLRSRLERRCTGAMLKTGRTLVYFRYFDTCVAIPKPNISAIHFYYLSHLHYLSHLQAKRILETKQTYILSFDTRTQHKTETICSYSYYKLIRRHRY